MKNPFYDDLYEKLDKNVQECTSESDWKYYFHSSVRRDGNYEFLLRNRLYKWTVKQENGDIVEINTYSYDKQKKKYLLYESCYIDGPFVVLEYYDDAHITDRFKTVKKPSLSLEKLTESDFKRGGTVEKWSEDGSYEVGKYIHWKYVPLEKYDKKNNLICKRVKVDCKYGTIHAWEYPQKDNSQRWIIADETIKEKARLLAHEHDRYSSEDIDEIMADIREVAIGKLAKRQTIAWVKKQDKKRTKIVTLLNQLNRLPPTSIRKAAKEAAVKEYRKTYPKDDR